MKIEIEVEFRIGQTVYFVPDGTEGIVTGLAIRPKNSIVYIVSWGGDKGESDHYSFELSAEKIIE